MGQFFSKTSKAFRRTFHSGSNSTPAVEAAQGKQKAILASQFTNVHHISPNPSHQNLNVNFRIQKCMRLQKIFCHRCILLHLQITSRLNSTIFRISSISITQPSKRSHPNRPCAFFTILSTSLPRSGKLGAPGDSFAAALVLLERWEGWEKLSSV